MNTAPTSCKLLLVKVHWLVEQLAGMKLYCDSISDKLVTRCQEIQPKVFT